MFMAGFNFFVLNNAFVSHWGFQVGGSPPDWRVEQRTTNEIKFVNFAKEVVARYDRDPMRMLAKLRALNTTEIIHRYAKNPPLSGYEI